MIYLDHYRYWRKYTQAQRNVDAILTEKEKLFQMTQPKSTMGEYEREFDKRISVGGKGGSKTNQIEEYVIRAEEEKIAQRLDEAKRILEDRLLLLKNKEEDLRKSKNNDDVLYTMRYIDHMRVRDISRKTHYSKSQIYRRLDYIRGKMKDATKWE